MSLSEGFYIKCALDFPCKKANLRLAVLNIFGECAMLSLCTKPGIEGTAKYQEILAILFHFSKPESLTVMKFLKPDFS